MKKMRKLIPAFAMLMVAAIMMTTASFAWFTMNENVTATGMQVQAKANGSLVIDDAALTYESGKATVSLDTGAHELYPIHMNADGTWSSPLNGSAVHSTYGTPGVGGLKDGVTATENTHYYDDYFYIGTAGDEALTNQKLTITLTAPTSAAGNATKAYSIAVYVLGTVNAANDGSKLITGTPTAIIHVDNSEDAADANDANNLRHIVEITGQTVPSIVGVGEQDQEKTGLKIGIRVFVDGGLKETTETQNVGTGYYKYTLATGNYIAGTAYFYSPADSAVYTALSAEEVAKSLNGMTPAGGWYTRSGAGTTDDPYVYTEVTTATTIAYNANDGTPTTTYYVRNYSEANTANFDANTSVATGNLYTRTEVTTTVYKHYVSGAAPSTGSVLALDIRTETVTP